MEVCYKPFVGDIVLRCWGPKPGKRTSARVNFGTRTSAQELRHTNFGTRTSARILKIFISIGKNQRTSAQVINFGTRNPFTWCRS